MRRIAGCIVAIVLMLPGMTHAQRRGNRQWWENPLIDGLNLTDAQRKQIQTTTREYRNRLVDARASVEKAEGDLRDVFNETTIDERRGNDAIDRLVKARGELTKIVSQMSLKLRTVLTTEQWQELQKRGRGPGRFGPPGPDSSPDGKNRQRGPRPNGPPPNASAKGPVNQ